MTVSRINPAAIATAALVAVCIAAGCNGGGSADTEGTRTGMPAVTPPPNQSEVRNFTQSELDRLRDLQERHNVARDEYWDDRGGVLANDVVEVWYPPGKLTVSHGMYVLDQAMQSLAEVDTLFGETPEQKLTIICSQSMEAYTEFTGRMWWNYSYISRDRIIYQPIPTLLGRGILDLALQREVYLWAFERIGEGKAPHWLVTGLASWIPDERRILEDNLVEFPDEPVKMAVTDVEAALAADNDKMRSRIAYYNAYRMVTRLGNEYGREKIAEMIKAIGDSGDLEAAAQSVFQRSYQDVVAFATDWEIPPPEPRESQ